MPIDTPLILGPFCVEADGTLRPREEDRPARFGFRWRSHVFAARLEEESLVLEARAGRLPSSAEWAAAIRRDFFESLPALRRLVPEPWRLGLTPAHSLALSARFALALPARISTLLTLLTGEVLRLAPYLELLEGAGVVPAAGGGRLSV